MRNYLQKLTLLFLAITCFLAVHAINADSWDLPVNSKSKKAVQLFQQGIQAMNDVDMPKATKLFNEAVEKDPNFFMAHCMLASFNLYFGNNDEFKAHAKNAVAIENLPDHEEIMQNALAQLVQDPQADVTKYGEKLVNMFPHSLAAHQMLATYQLSIEDNEAALNTYLSMLVLAENKAPIYNMLGYAYMRLDKMDKAKEAFETYIKLAPKNPNVYDSMGDYYMAVKDYKNAHKYFMKAHEINEEWSYEKAMKAKEMMEK